MLSRFFLDRPVFAWVIAIILMVAGGLAIFNLPIAQYPPIAPPSISITAFYPGASAETVENSVTQIIEQKMTGFDKMLYISASSDSSGAARIDLTFAPGTDPDLAWAQVQNKLQLAMANLPAVVQNQGVKVSKSTRNYLMIVGLVSPDATMDGKDLRDYAQSSLEKVLSRVPGVGEVEVFGSQYSMRIWLNPERLTQYQMTIQDVIMGLRAYNVEISAGQFGGAPAVAGQRLNASIIVQTLLKTPDEFAAIPLRTHPDGSVVRVKDVGRAELGTESYDVEAFFNGKPAAALAIRQSAGANALATANAIRAKLGEMSQFFPPGMKVVYPYDTTPFVRVAIHEVVKTLFEAILLVFLVMYLFMGNMRATLIPTIAVPVVILGTFAVLGFFGFSINMLTMFAMVLAIGLLVDDAIVVVENVERLMSEQGLSPFDATRKSMEQITSALIGIGLVLSAVFGPMAFFGGSTGVIYRQFSVTIIASMLLSVVVALILTPVLCVSFLRPVPKGHESSESGVWFMRPFFRWFDRLFFRFRDRYVGVVGHSLVHKPRYVILFVLIVFAMGFLFRRMPSAYLPDEDQGILMAQALLPGNSTLEQTKKVMEGVRDHFLEQEKEAVESIMTVSGIAFSGRGQNAGLAFVKLRDWDIRPRPDLKAFAVAGRAMATFSKIRSAMVFAFAPPAVIELGMAKGFDFQLLDRGGLGHARMMEARNQLLGMAAQNPVLSKVRPNGLEDVPEYRVDVDWEKAGAMGVPISSIHNTISAAFGSAYVNDFIQGGRVKRVYVQADAPYRMSPNDLEKLYVRNTIGKMVPFSSFASGHWTSGSPKLERFNGFPSINIQGESAPGRSSGEAMRVMESFVKDLPQGVGYDWTGLSYQERQAGVQAGPLYAFSILIIFLCVAALYESWTIPFVNLLMLPLGVFGATVATYCRGMPNDVYFQIGFLTTLGLSTKNAILIIQFAKQRIDQGEGLVEATLNAVKTRFRPVMMTSLAFFFGVLPLAIATGAGAGAQNAIGTAVVGGMISATFVDLLFIPLFFVLVTRFFEKGRKQSVTGIILVLLGSSLLPLGCTMAPNYTRPEAPVPTTWPVGPAYAETAVPTNAVIAADLGWQAFFTDEKLRHVIAASLTNNLDLRAATLNVELARAIYGIQRAALLPSFSLGASESKAGVPADISSTGSRMTTTRYDANLGIVAWEVDFFGRIRSLKDRALYEYLSTEEARRSAQILLISSVAQAYLALAGDRECLALAETTLTSQAEGYALIKRRYDRGIVTELDLYRAQTQVDTARGDVAAFKQRVAQDENALTLLAGGPVPAALLPTQVADLAPPQAIQAGISSDVLLRRPDVVQSENMLKAAHADIGAARAAFFPRISLTTAIGTASSELSGLFMAGSGAWMYAPQIVMPLFDARTWSALKAAKAQQKLAVTHYEKSIQSAFREVADALAVRGTVNEQVAAQESLVHAVAATHRLSTARYDKGIDSYLSVLDAQRSLYRAQQGLVLLKFAKLVNQVHLYAVLGGGGDLPELKPK